MPNKAPIGIYGGTFDPVHLGHLALAQTALATLGLSSVRWMPAGRPNLRNSPEASGEVRAAMLECALRGYPEFVLDTIELATDTPSYTVNTLARLRASGEYAHDQSLVLLMGADAFRALPAWHRFSELFDLAHIAVVCRPGYSLTFSDLGDTLQQHLQGRWCDQVSALSAAPSGRVLPFTMPLLDISATAIRARIRHQQSLTGWVPQAVADFISEHRLYQGNVNT